MSVGTAQRHSEDMGENIDKQVHLLSGDEISITLHKVTDEYRVAELTIVIRQA